MHWPASFDRDGANFSHRTDDLLPNDWVLPFINHKDLKEPKALIIFINARGRHAPVAFTMTGTKFLLPLTVYDYARKERDRMDLSDMDNYSKIIRLETQVETFNSEKRSCGLPVVTGLFVLRVQVRILRVLLRCSQSILGNQDLYLLASDAFPAVAKPASISTCKTRVSHLSQIWFAKVLIAHA